MSLKKSLVRWRSGDSSAASTLAEQPYWNVQLIKELNTYFLNLAPNGENVNLLTAWADFTRTLLRLYFDDDQQQFLSSVSFFFRYNLTSSPIPFKFWEKEMAFLFESARSFYSQPEKNWSSFFENQLDYSIYSREDELLKSNPDSAEAFLAWEESNEFLH